MLNYINLYILLLISSIIIYSYGILFLKFFSVKIDNSNIIFIIGCFFIGSITLILNFFFPINKIITNTLLFIGIIISIQNYKKFKDINSFLLVSFIAYLTLIFENNYRPDAGLYHLPFISILNENKIIFGLNNLHSRFGHVSFFQYISAAFNNSIFQDKAIYFPLGILYSSILIYFYNLSKSKIIPMNIKVLSMIFGLFICIDMNRFSEFGNDEISHMIYFILIINILLLFKNFKKKIEERLNLILVLSLFLFLNKSVYILVFIFLLYIFFSYFKEIIIFNKINLFLFLILFLWIMKNFFISSCLIYPFEITCFDSFIWSNQNYKSDNIIIEAWAKGFPDQNKFNNLKIYISDFRWIATWFSNHFYFVLKKLYILIIFLLLIIFFINYKGKTYFKDSHFTIILLINLIIVFLWFIKFPVYRFGSGFILTAIVLIGNIFLIKINKQNFYKSLKFCKIIAIGIIVLKNTNRIVNNHIQNNSSYTYINPYSDNNEKIKYYKKFYINSGTKFYYITKSQNCYYGPSPCTSVNVEEQFYHTKMLSYDVIYKKNN